MRDQVVALDMPDSLDEQVQLDYYWLLLVIAEEYLQRVNQIVVDSNVLLPMRFVPSADRAILSHCSECSLVPPSVLAVAERVYLTR